MRKFLALLILTGIALAGSGCSEPEDQRAEFYVFGTLVEVLIRHAGNGDATEAFGDLQLRFQDMHRDWHAWEPGALTGINQAFAKGREATAPQDILTLIKRSQELEVLTNGRFNAAMGGLIRLWGFHTSEFPVTGPVPTDAAIREVLNARPTTANIRINGDRVFSSNPAVQLDFGGIAKGYAVDLAIETLARHGFHSVLINAGGDLKATGGSVSRPWRVGISRPGGGVIGGVEIPDSDAVFTSGVSQRFLEGENHRYPHILDPLTGQPVSGLASATVITDEAMLADAAATALMVAGLDGWAGVARALALDKVLLVDGQGKIYLTPAMQTRFKPQTGAVVQVLE